LLNNPRAKLPPLIKRLEMKMQNPYFEAVHIPGKSNMTVYMSRHLLKETGRDSTEKQVQSITQTDHAIVWSKIKKATELNIEGDKELIFKIETPELFDKRKGVLNRILIR
jgi:hypothetical protein